MDFHSPSYRASGSDLTVSISPLGLVELADEEFEVHGPRLNRYAAAWAWYLGHHWGYRREQGDNQVTLNYIRALSDFITNFTFGRGVNFTVPDQNMMVTPYTLRRVWEIDNQKDKILWEMGQLGGVTGDCFAKVAYEDPFVDPAGRVNAGRIRILPLNPSSCFPEFHPHDRSRLLRFKLKYRFWGCFDMNTEALTKRGWKTHDELLPDDEILTLDPTTDAIQWEVPSAVSVYDYDGELIEWDGRVKAAATPNHRWLGEDESGGRLSVFGEFINDFDKKLVVGGGTPLEFRAQPKWSDELVETVAWYVCDGSDHINQTGFRSIHLSGKKPHKVAAWRRLAQWWTAEGATWREGKTTKTGQASFYLGKGVVAALREVAPDKEITPEFLCSLTYAQAKLFRDTLIDGDGCRTHHGRNTVRWTQLDGPRKDAYQMLCAMLGIRSTQTSDGEKVQEYQSRYVQTRHLNEERVHYTGKVWCPTVSTGYFMARHNGNTYWTGNTSLEGTRQVFTYTELLTDEAIEEYINDELIDARPNPLGKIPVAHVANVPVASSPWGISDIYDIIPVNREYNEKMTEMSDIINYHASPVTIITGAKAGQLERGPKRVWAGLPKDANVFNLEMQNQLQGPMEYIASLKRAMHELTGVPETALGQVQPISNTSGVALSIQYQPLMNRYGMKKLQYTQFLQQINELILLTAAVYEPNLLAWDPSQTEPIPGAAEQLDPADPVTYQTSIQWPNPLPVDALIKLNEEQMKIMLGIQSKRGAMSEMGEAFPNEKMDEIFNERRQDALEDGALSMITTQIQQAVLLTTGLLPQPEGGAELPKEPSGGGNGGSSGGDTGGSSSQSALSSIPPVEQELMNQLVQKAYGAKFAQRRNPESD